MMFRTIAVSGALLLLGLGGSLETQAAELESGYLLGTWVIDDTDCASQTSELVIFRDSGAIESLRAGRLEAAGFWKVDGDVIETQLVASPAFFHDAKADFASLATTDGEYSTFRVRVIPLNLEQDRFDAVGLLGDQVAQAVFRRCAAPE